MDQLNQHPVVCFGEILWDMLPSGSVPGGAPMNVAYHLYKSGKNPALVTRIGLDDMGRELVDIFSGHGICTDYFQLDHTQETGKVYGTLKETNEMVYEFVTPAAWDFIQWDDGLANLVSQSEFFVFGSLGSRNLVSRDTLFRMINHAKRKVLDINLRAPFYYRALMEELLRKADIVKMNESELELISGWFSTYKSDEERMHKIQDVFSIPHMVVTRGEKGAIMNMDGVTYHEQGIPVVVADTVGSGDAFLAGLLSQMLDEKSPQEALQFAGVLGAFIATQKGGCPDYEMTQVENLRKPVRLNG